MELVEGGGGVFTLSVDGSALFEKRRAGRFPTESEALALLGPGRSGKQG